MSILLRTMQTASAQTGGLLVSVLSSVNNRPIENAVVTISYTGNPNNIIEQVRTNSSGQTELLSLSAPPLEYSMEPGIEQPYSEYTLNVTAEGFEPFDVSGTEVLPNNNSVQEIHLDPITPTGHGTNLVIPAHTLYGNYPPKIAEAEIKPLDESGEIVLSRVVIPEYIVVHDGAPTDSSAQNHYVLYRDYIKNVASSEIYATWPTSTITANVLAIMSFTLNRVYTEWYRNKGFNFTITSSTAFDHKWINGRNIFDTISLVVDEIFDQYLARPDVKQPILTQYCDGRRSTCPNWMTQWGSKSLGDQGYSPIEIIRHFYGSDMYINTAEQISGVPSSWPGYTLTIGSSGDKVRQMQEHLDVIAEVYSAIPRIAADGIYGPMTQSAVKEFQSIFGLPQTGEVDFATWYKISQIYVGISRIAELN